MMGYVVDSACWPAACIFTPLILAMLIYGLGDRWARPFACAGAVLIPVAAAALLIQVARIGPVRYAIGDWSSPLGIDWYVDGLSSLLVAMTAAVGSAVTWYALTFLTAAQKSFWPAWFFVWAALNALLLAADLFNLYVTLELLTLGAVTLIALSVNTAALVAAFRYLVVALMGSLLYLLGVTLLYCQYGTLDIKLLGERVEPVPVVFAAQAAMALGLLAKTALVPLHFWLPAAHSAAVAPVSAVLSALVVKASYYALVRLWLEVFAVTPSAVVDQLLGCLGAVAIACGSIQAFRAERLKQLVAYSTVAQIGYLFLLFPLLNHANVTGSALVALALFVTSHALAKAAAFMVAGAVIKEEGHDRIADLLGLGNRLPLATFGFALAAMSLMGLPPSGGFSAKWLMLHASFDAGQWYWAAVIVLGGLLSAAYLFRVLGRVLQTKPHEANPNSGNPSSVMPLQTSAFLLALMACGLGFLGGPIAELLESGFTSSKNQGAP